MKRSGSVTKNFHHQHNIVNPEAAFADRTWGIRVTLPASDPFTRLVGSDWSKEHWYPSQAERDRALKNMRTRHGYYRIGDEVSLIFEEIQREN